MTSPTSPIFPQRPGGSSHVIQGFFPAGRPRFLCPTASPPPVAPPPPPATVQAHLAKVQPAVMPGRPGAIQPAVSPASPANKPRPILPGTPQRGAIQPFVAAKPVPPRPVLPPAPGPAALQPSAGHAFALPATFHLRPFGTGQRLPEAVQQKMGAFFRDDFADVRVHVGNEASSLGALAFTHGSDLYFAPGQYNPLTPQGQRLLGHELTHVVQQRSGRVRNPLGSGLAVVQDPALEAEAERMAARLMTIQPSTPLPLRGPDSMRLGGEPRLPNQSRTAGRPLGPARPVGQFGPSNRSLPDANYAHNGPILPSHFPGQPHARAVQQAREHPWWLAGAAVVGVVGVYGLGTYMGWWGTTRGPHDFVLLDSSTSGCLNTMLAQCQGQSSNQESAVGEQVCLRVLRSKYDRKLTGRPGVDIYPWFNFDNPLVTQLNPDFYLPGTTSYIDVALDKNATELGQLIKNATSVDKTKRTKYDAKYNAPNKLEPDSFPACPDLHYATCILALNPIDASSLVIDAVGKPLIIICKFEGQQSWCIRMFNMFTTHCKMPDHLEVNRDDKPEAGPDQYRRVGQLFAFSSLDLNINLHNPCVSKYLAAVRARVDEHVKKKSKKPEPWANVESTLSARMTNSAKTKEDIASALVKRQAQWKKEDETYKKSLVSLKGTIKQIVQQDLGTLFEELVYPCLLQKYPSSDYIIYQNLAVVGAELDFVIYSTHHEVIVVSCKCNVKDYNPNTDMGHWNTITKYKNVPAVQRKVPWLITPGFVEPIVITCICLKDFKLDSDGFLRLVLASEADHYLENLIL
jgi:hypothetical protein